MTRLTLLRSWPSLCVTSVAVALTLAGCAEPSSTTPANSTGPTDAGTYVETRDLSGQALADALGLDPLDVPRGETLGPNDPRLGPCAEDSGEIPAGIVSTGVAVYCLAGAVETALEEWDVAMRLAGFGPPCDLQVEACRLASESERLAESGDDVAAQRSSSEAHDLRIEASKTPGCGERVTDPASH